MGFQILLNIIIGVVWMFLNNEWTRSNSLLDIY